MPPDASIQNTDDRVRVRRWPVLRDAGGYVRGYLQYLSFDAPLAFRLLRGGRPSVVVAEPPPTTGLVVRLVCGIRRVPYVYYAADVWSDAAGSSAPRTVVRVLRAVESWVLRGAAHVVAVTEGVAKRVGELGAADVTLVRNGIDSDVFSAEGPRDDLGPTAVYAGTMSEWQGADIFVRALPAVRAQVSGARLAFLGQGSAAKEIVELARSLGVGDAVTVHGVVPPEEASRWLRSARAGLVSIKPGQGYDFAFPTKILASLACGTPVLFAGVGEALSVIVDEGLGRVVGYDVEAVAQALVEMLALPAQETDRSRIAGWAGVNASSRHSAAMVADTVLGTIPGRDP